METAITSDAELLARIEAFCADHTMAPTTFGRAALGDGSLVANLKAGRSVTLKSAQRVAQFMATYSADQADARAA